MVKQPGYEVNHSSPSTAKVKNEKSYTSTPPISLYMTMTGKTLPFITLELKFNITSGIKFFVMTPCTWVIQKSKGNLFIKYTRGRHTSSIISCVISMNLKTLTAWSTSSMPSEEHFWVFLK
jgi:hypothetical protein